MDSLSLFYRRGNRGFRGTKRAELGLKSGPLDSNLGASPCLPSLCLLASVSICFPACCAFAGFMAISELGEIALWLCRNKEARR